MYLKIKKKKIEIRNLTGFWERFKGLKFVLEQIDYGVKFPKKRTITTNFLCQLIDVALTDKNDKILYLYEDFRTERRIFPRWKVRNIYFLPVGTAKELVIGEKMPIVDEDVSKSLKSKEKKKKNNEKSTGKNQ